MKSLDEAIQHCLEVAEKKERQAKGYPKADGRKGSGIRRYKCVECAEEHRQLAEWLRKLKKVQEIIAQHDTDSMPEDFWYIDRIREAIK